MNIEKILLISFSLLLVNPFLYWEDLSKQEQDKITHYEMSNEYIYDFLKDRLKIEDSNQTKALLNILSDLPPDKTKKAFYFYLYNQICQKADGATSEILGLHCQNIILKDTEYVLFYLKTHTALLKVYAQFLGTEFFFKEDGASELKYTFKDFKSILNEKLKDKPEYESILTLLYKEIELYMKEME